MDFDSDSSDFHFPTDTGLAKLSSPLSYKVPESRDWALDEFMQTLQDKPCTEAENLLSFKQYIPVNDSEEEDYDDDYNYGPPKLNLPTYEEKDFLSQLSQHLLNLERMELHDILKGGFTLVQNDIQTNSQYQHQHQHQQQQQQQQQQLHSSPFNQQTLSPPGLSWFNEAADYGRVQIDSLDTIEMPKRQNNFSPFPIKSTPRSEEEEQDTTAVQPQTEKPLPPLPAVIAPKEVVVEQEEKATSVLKNNKHKGLKFKLKTKLVKPFSNSISASTLSEKPKKSSSILSSTKKFIRKILPVSS
ncbi:uncharacterized protein B0P05DRAFT_531364 [Gilbertella persicaria]|uniref:Uncharacterized protein n=1 Tax=Rhizopus stolonifer TaxID=4846 RepID=A0A367KUV1_RHIST|nr:uncharacterized protein B0P05DRAFT_531364 [Gilbertella persicaria]KAI8088074.1 hypothetical protein B0P05DRAFT_531364 [Gilbertella persicaria]RCI05937.1 hypothetical protein CU098_012437 [Rhizopus stolonifer]